MRTKTLSFAATVVLIAAAFGTVTAARAAQGADGSSAVGGFSLFESPMTLSARRGPDREVTGHMSSSFGFTGAGPVSCLAVAGNLAIAGGRVESRETGLVYNLYLEVEDNDGLAGSVPDRAAWLTAGPPTQAACDFFLFYGAQYLSPIDSGNIVVQDGSS
jgi:hypothetical protein